MDMRTTTVIDTTTEPLITLYAAAALIPPARKGKKTNFSTIFRWVFEGVHGPDGERVRLEAVRVGCRWMTSRQALQRFVERLTPRIGEAPDSPGRRTPGRRQRASERAAKQLESMGV
jgi:hypothetical protein